MFGGFPLEIHGPCASKEARFRLWLPKRNALGLAVIYMTPLGTEHFCFSISMISWYMSIIEGFHSKDFAYRNHLLAILSAVITINDVYNVEGSFSNHFDQHVRLGGKSFDSYVKHLK